MDKALKNLYEVEKKLKAEMEKEEMRLLDKRQQKMEKEQEQASKIPWGFNNEFFNQEKSEEKENEDLWEAFEDIKSLLKNMGTYSYSDIVSDTTTLPTQTPSCHSRTETIRCH